MEPAKKPRDVFLILAAIPIVLCLFLSLIYDDRDPESGLAILAIGLFLTHLILPLYLTILCCVFAIKKNLRFDFCACVCFVINLVFNIVLVIVLGAISDAESTFAMILWMLIPVVISMAVMGGFLGIGYIPYRRAKKRRGE